MKPLKYYLNGTIRVPNLFSLNLFYMCGCISLINWNDVDEEIIRLLTCQLFVLQPRKKNVVTTDEGALAEESSPPMKAVEGCPTKLSDMVHFAVNYQSHC